MIARKFAPEDAEPLSRLIVKNLRSVNIRDYSTEAIEALVSHYSPEKLTNLAKNCQMIVCFYGDDLIGMAALEMDRVRNIFVNVNMHKMGIGRLLMANLEHFAVEYNLTRIYLHAGLSAEGFYHKLGYEIIEGIDRELDGNPLPVIKMEKRLSRG